MKYAMRELGLNEFEEAIKGDAVLVQFATRTCKPCKIMTETLVEIFHHEAHALPVAKVYVDDKPELPEKYDFMSVPTTILFKNGEAVHTMYGFRTKGALMDELRRYL